MYSNHHFVPIENFSYISEASRPKHFQNDLFHSNNDLYEVNQNLQYAPTSTPSDPSLLPQPQPNQFFYQQQRPQLLPNPMQPSLALTARKFSKQNENERHKRTKRSLSVSSSKSSRFKLARESPKLGNEDAHRTMKPKIATTYWEDEKTLCYQVKSRGHLVSRREDNNQVNGTKLLNVVGMSRGKRDGILKNEKLKNATVVKIGSMNLKGIWIPFERAREIARNEGVDELLYPLFVEDIKSFFTEQGSKMKRESDTDDESDYTGNDTVEMPHSSSPSPRLQTIEVAYPNGLDLNFFAENQVRNEFYVPMTDDKSYKKTV